MIMLSTKKLTNFLLLTILTINQTITTCDLSNYQQIDLNLTNNLTDHSQLEYILEDTNSFRDLTSGYHNIIRQPHKKWTMMIYVAADNDLFYFAWNNIRQLAQNAHSDINIIVFLSEPGAHKKSQIYLIEKNKATL